MHRKDIMVYLYNPRKRFFHVVVELRDEGALPSLFSSLSQMGLSVMNAFTSPDGGRNRICSLFAEARDDRVTASQLKGILDSWPQVIRSWARESKSGFLVEAAHFPLALNTGQRVVVLGQRRLSNIFHRLTSRLGGEAANILYEEGFSLGKNSAEVFIYYMVGERFVRENLEDILMVYSATGWGRPELVKTDVASGEYIILIRDCFECEGLKTGRPQSHFVRGHLCGLLSTISRRPLSCVETKCLAAGHEHCEFHLSQAEAGRETSRL